MKRSFVMLLVVLSLATSCNTKTQKSSKNENTKENIEKSMHIPESINIKGIAQNPEGIEFDKNDNTFLLSSLNAGPIIKINLDGSYKAFTSGESFPMSTAGLQIDYKRNTLLATGFNGLELMDEDPNTKGISNLRVYNLTTGVIERDINLSALVPDAPAYMANDIAVDKNGNVYVTDWFAGVVYKVDENGEPSVFWRNETGIKSGGNGIDYHPDGYLLVSLVSVNEKGLYANYGLVKIPISNPEQAKLVKFVNAGFTGFDGMVLKSNGNVVGVTNNGTSPGGNTLVELSSDDNWETAKIVNTKAIKPSTTLAITPDNLNYIINQDFSPEAAKSENWTIERIEF